MSQLLLLELLLPDYLTWLRKPSGPASGTGVTQFRISETSAGAMFFFQSL